MSKIILSLAAVLVTAPIAVAQEAPHHGGNFDVANAPTQATAVEPIPGSITYGGPTRSRLQKTPVGSTFGHSFTFGGYEYRERYVVDTDGRPKLVYRTNASNN